MRLLRGAVLGVLAAGMAGPGWARTMTMMATSLGTETVASGRGQQFFVRFDGPVNHQGATLDVLQG